MILGTKCCNGTRNNSTAMKCFNGTSHCDHGIVLGLAIGVPAAVVVLLLVCVLFGICACLIVKKRRKSEEVDAHNIDKLASLQVELQASNEYQLPSSSLDNDDSCPNSASQGQYTSLNTDTMDYQSMYTKSTSLWLQRSDPGGGESGGAMGPAWMQKSNLGRGKSGAAAEPAWLERSDSNGEEDGTPVRPARAAAPCGHYANPNRRKSEDKIASMAPAAATSYYANTNRESDSM